VKFRLISVGRPKAPFILAAMELYAKRLASTGEFEWKTVKGRTAEEEGQRLLSMASGIIVVLDEQGLQLASLDIAKKIRTFQEQGNREISFLVGGAEGHHPLVRDKADSVWSLSRLTLQHDIALLLTVEQLYRAGTIIRGEPYHRGQTAPSGSEAAF